MFRFVSLIQVSSERYPAFVFVTFEGPEGAGKTTVIEQIAGRLMAEGNLVFTTREPGAGSFGASIRKILLEGDDMPALSELFLFLADRANHVETLIKPALTSGKVVLCDRYIDSTVVYQGIARGLDREMLTNLNQIATGGLLPDLTLLLDVPIEIGLARVTQENRLDKESTDFHNAVRQGFLAEASANPQRWTVVDANQPLNSVIQACWNAISAKL